MPLSSSLTSHFLPIAHKKALYSAKIMSRSSFRSLPGLSLSRVAPRARPKSADAAAPAEAPQPAAAAEAARRKVMVVADGGGAAARTALQWALSHSVRAGDTLVLLDVVKPAGKNGDEQLGQKGRGPKEYQVLEAMKSICQAKVPEVHVELSLVEGKERGPAIVEAARKQGVSLLVMGQRKRSLTWRLLLLWTSGGDKAAAAAAGTVEYCVQNAACMALAVRRKSRRGGGYLVTTRRHRDFWLLA